MVVGVYLALMMVILVMWVWSIYLQRELTVNSVTLRVGDSISWVFAIILGIGVGGIIASNFLPVQVWKVFIFLIAMLAVDGVILWLTATWVHAMTSHKIPQEYRLDNRKREDRKLEFILVLVGSLIVGVIVLNEPMVTLASFLSLPLVVLLERTVALRGRIKEVSQFDTYTEEEVHKAEENLRQAIAEGKVLKPKENVLKKIIKNEKKRYKNMANAVKSEEESDKLVKHIKQNNQKEDGKEDDAK